MGKKWTGKGVERFVNGKVAGREWLPTWAACRVHLLQNAVTSRHRHHLLESKSASAAAAWPTALGTELYGEHQGWLFFTVKFKLVWSSHRFLNHRCTESGVCHLRWALGGFCRDGGECLFLCLEGQGSFPSCKWPCKRKGKANAIGRLTVVCGKCCVTGTETSTVPQCVPPKGKRERAKKGVCGGGGRWGFPFHKSFGVGGVRLKFMSLWGLMQNF